MNIQVTSHEVNQDAALTDVIKIAILAVGGQGGGVLTGWIADLAKRGGYDVQTTSVAGVAQRTGATIYYIEMVPKSHRIPIFAQSPSPGDVDIVIAAELMEAGRSILRGFVTPERTTLIASTHRIPAISEKQVPGNGRADSNLVNHEIMQAALNTVCFDMERIAMNAGSVISSSLFGGLAKSKALPFKAELFEEVIRASGRDVHQSISAFRATLNYDPNRQRIDKQETKDALVSGPTHLLTGWQTLLDKLKSISPAAQPMAEAGLRKVVDYQDLNYGAEYIEYLQNWHKLDNEEGNYELTRSAAKHIANAMCYDDLIRVADLKIRASRNTRLRNEQEVDADAIVHVTEYFHPRAQELCSSMPHKLGNWFENSPKAFKLLDRIFNKGRRVRTDHISGFLLLFLISCLKPYRRKLLRHKQEVSHLEKLLATAQSIARDDYQLAIEVLNCQRLIKGYSDTHVRGYQKFGKIINAAEILKGRDDAAEWVKRLREIALKDLSGIELDGALKTVKSFTQA